METLAQAPPQPTPQQIMLGMISGYWNTQVLASAVRLGVVEALPGRVDDLSQRLNLNSDGLHRLLRGAAVLGVVQEVTPGEFRLTEMGEQLRSDHPGSMAPMALMLTDPGHYLPWSRLDHSVRTGRHAVTEATGVEGIFQYFAQNSAEGERFNAAMGSLSRAFAREVGDFYDFTPYRQIADVGGSHGVLLAAALKSAPQARGILFDQPQVLQNADVELRAQGVLDRVTRVSGNFFEGVVAGADLYMLKHILHDWNDEECVTILRHVRRNMDPQGRVLVVELLLADQPGPADMMNLNMLVLTTGRERTQAQFEQLFAQANLRLTRVLPTPGIYHLIEAEPI